MDHYLRPTIGMEIVDEADRLIGIIDTVEHDHFVVQKGFFFPRNHRIPITAIDSIEDNLIRLRISREVALSASVDYDWTGAPHYGEMVPPQENFTRPSIVSGAEPRKV